MSWNLSLDTYFEITISRNRKAIVRKFNLGETLEFSVRYNYMLTAPKGKTQETALKELVRFCLNGKRIFLTREDRLTVVSEVKKRIDKILRKSKNLKHEKEWLQNVIVYFARNLHYNKGQTLALYPEEIPLLVRECENSRISEMILLAGLIHSPAETLKRIEDSRSLNEQASQKLDRESLDRLKASHKITPRSRKWQSAKIKSE